MNLATTITLFCGGVGSGRHKEEEDLAKKGFTRDNRIVNSPFGNAYRHKDFPNHRFHIVNEKGGTTSSDDSDVEAGGPGSGRRSNKAVWDCPNCGTTMYKGDLKKGWGKDACKECGATRPGKGAGWKNMSEQAKRSAAYHDPRQRGLQFKRK